MLPLLRIPPGRRNLLQTKTQPARRRLPRRHKLAAALAIILGVLLAIWRQTAE